MVSPRFLTIAGGLLALGAAVLAYAFLGGGHLNELPGPRDPKPDLREIPGSDIDAACADPNTAATQLRIVPSEVNGVSGMKLAGLRRDTAFTRAGLQNGDIVMRVNGESLDSPAKVEGLCAVLRAAPTLSLLVVRDGREMVLDYVVRR